MDSEPCALFILISKNFSMVDTDFTISKQQVKLSSDPRAMLSLIHKLLS